MLCVPWGLFKMDPRGNLEKIKKGLREKNLTALYFNTADEYLNEYCELENSWVYHLSGFSGSTAFVLVKTEGKSLFIVDGRYHGQADREVSTEDFEILKPNDFSMEIVKKEIQRCGEGVAIIAERSSYAQITAWQKDLHLTPIKDEYLKALVPLPHQEPQVTPFKIPAQVIGETPLERAKRVCPTAQSAYYLSALDSISWITTFRAQQRSESVVFAASALVTSEQVHVFLPASVQTPEEAVTGVCFYPVSKRAEILKKELETCEQLFIQERHATYSDYAVIKDLVPHIEIKKDGDAFFKIQSIKTAQEIQSYQEFYRHADNAVYELISYCQNKFKSGEPLREKEIYDHAFSCYQKHGAMGVSFNPITAVGEHAAQGHFNAPEEERIVQDHEMILIDSGAYFNGLGATDCTRTFSGSQKKEKISPRQRHFYTLVLKGLLQGMRAIFPKGTTGVQIDALVRSSLWQNGYNYAHGTGHGVGILVHEGGVNISHRGTMPFQVNQLVTIEPGAYFENEFGIRLENLVFVKEHPEYAGYLCFESLSYLGFDRSLIEESLLSREEKAYLEQYEEECERRGTLFS